MVRFSSFFSPISCFFVLVFFWGGLRGGNNVLSRAFYLTPLCWCYVVNFLPRPLHALDATLWTFLDLYTLLMLRCELFFLESVCHQQKVFVKPGTKVDIGTQIIDRTWLEMKTWLGRKYPVSIGKNKHRIKDPTLGKLIFQFVFRQSVLPLNPQGFMSQLRRLLKSNWAQMEKVKVRTDGPQWPYIPNMV